ncbi:RNA 2',3'-cyclic phosphodiesterase [Fonticella tunisiensis]|uniref:RNA 2',3'-cyclic phosphodiesterase n=1 Tax=Fonticella tunisiensis TaxID=1096341 RepID=A0A4R7KPW1_9CLOT|nr:RNA 2',3'-cyclic phosphodiesterase [Fonticella tunisiensis]TDT61179.1 2'-5' RNA ligase [Fonticella tunisiensis]
MRIFITLKFDKSAREKLKTVQDIIKKNSERGRFKHIDNFHLTLKFLGEVEEETVELIYNDLLLELNEMKKFKLKIMGINAFGKEDIIRTIYLGVEGQKDMLYNLAAAVEKVAVKYGFKSERNYTPHVTIAQNVKLNKPFKILQEELCGFCIDNLIFDSVIIMKSEQIGNKRIYTPVKTIKLK